MLHVAFKEWAAICAALADGRQSLILRKGGIAEEAGEFRPEHDRFLLYPTFFHEHRNGVKADLLPLLERAEFDRPPAGFIAFSHFAHVNAVRNLTDLEPALALEPFHGWTASAITQRFHYRSPGLFALVVRVYRLPAQVLVAEAPHYAGCKSWVLLETPIDLTGAVPVMSDDAFDAYRAAVLTSG